MKTRSEPTATFKVKRREPEVLRRGFTLRICCRRGSDVSLAHELRGGCPELLQRFPRVRQLLATQIHRAVGFANNVKTRTDTGMAVTADRLSWIQGEQLPSPQRGGLCNAGGRGGGGGGSRCIGFAHTVELYRPRPGKQEVNGETGVMSERDRCLLRCFV
jgi:hypothetical protein